MEEQKKDTYLSVVEVADWLGLTIVTVRNKHKKDPTFPASIAFSDKDHRFKESEIKAWLQKKEAERESGS